MVCTGSNSRLKKFYPSFSTSVHSLTSLHMATEVCVATGASDSLEDGKQPFGSLLRDDLGGPLQVF